MKRNLYQYTIHVIFQLWSLSNQLTIIIENIKPTAETLQMHLAYET